MTATDIRWRKSSMANGTRGGDDEAKSLASVTEIATVAALDASRMRPRSVLSNTEIDEGSSRTEKSSSPPVERIYPHIFDEDLSAGQANIHIQNAVRAAQLAIEAFGEPDLQAVTTHLGQIAIAMSTAYPLTEFNESLGAVVAFVRRATLVASAPDLSRSALNALVNALQFIASNPMLDLEEASDLVDRLTDEQWQGGHKLADELMAVLLSESELDEHEAQALLFPQSATSEG